MIMEAEDSLPTQKASARTEPEGWEDHFWLGFTLSRLAQADEALESFHGVLNCPDDTDSIATDGEYPG
jgi:hypothetical protein